MKNQKILGFALGLLCAWSVHAAPLTFGFSGTVTQIPADDPGGGIGVDTSFTGRYSFDSAAVDAIAGGTQGSYTSSGAGFGLSLQIGSNSYAMADFLNIGISNDLLGSDQYTVFAIDGALSVSILLEDLTAAVFSSDALPGLPPPIASFAVRDFHFFDTSLGDVQIDGVINQIDCLRGCGIPEPGTLLLLGAGLLAGALRRHLKQ